MTRIGKALRLSAPERQVLLRAALLLPVVSLGLRAIGFRRVREALAPRSRCRNLDLEPGDLARVVRGVARAGPIRARCLAESLVIWSMLARYGYDVRLRLGVRKTGGAMEAHAWVERDGIPLNDDADVHERYAVLTGADR